MMLVMQNIFSKDGYNKFGEEKENRCLCAKANSLARFEHILRETFERRVYEIF